MNSMEPLAPLAVSPSRRMIWPVCYLLMAFALCRVASAADSYYINNSILTYPGTVDYPPQIDATNFINNSSFTINFTVLSVNNEFYQPVDTVNYTNIGTMTVNAGFQFDTLSSVTGFHTRAGSFYNPGFISCGSILNDPGAVFLTGFGQCLINATNVLNPGALDVGPDGFIGISGKNVDLSQSSLTVDGFGANVGFTADIGGTAIAGLNTNFWDPAAALGAKTNYSSLFQLAPFQLYLTNCTPYISFEGVDNGTNVFEAVFIEDDSGSNISTTVYFGDSFPGFGGFDDGTVTIQWAGTYLDTVNNILVPHYLYLNDDYALGASTNVLPITIPPINFTVTESTTPENFAPLTPATPGFFPIFLPNATVTNYYVYANLNLLASPDTNGIANHSITNLPGRIQISGDNYLNLSNAEIIGPSYVSLISSNNFAGSGGALIQTPYSDLNLGQRNGVLYITNTIQANIPFWGGNIQAWNTAWYDAGSSNLYRVLIVGSRINPTIGAQVQNLTLRDYSSNNIVISDTFNVMKSFYTDCQSLTLTTNPPGFGATSLDGELNLESPSIFMNSSAPNLRYLTNNGAVRMQNLMYFAYPTLTNISGGTTNVVSFLNNSALINNGVFMDQGSVIYAGTFENSGIFSNGLGSFTLQSLTTTLTNGSLQAGGDVSITTSSLLASNSVLQASRSLTLQVTNLLTDTGVTNGNVWSVGSASVGNGISLPLFPVNGGNLLGTTITLSAPTNRSVANVWAGHDYGISNAGYTNNEAVGQLRLDAANSLVPGHNGSFVFNAPGISNALYVDLLVLTNYATQGNSTNNFNFPWLHINSNMYIYYARAVETFSNGLTVDESQAIDTQSKLGANGGRLRWISSYAGYYSSTNFVYTNSMGVAITNTVNSALAQSSAIDSDGDGLVNSLDPTPFFLASQLNFTLLITNLPPKTAKIQWTTVPNATNFVYYSTNLFTTNWLAYTNFNNWYYGNNVAVTNSSHGNSFHSPQVYPGANPSAPDNGMQTNVWVFDSITNVPHYYKVVVWPWVDFAP